MTLLTINNEVASWRNFSGCPYTSLILYTTSMCSTNHFNPILHTRKTTSGHNMAGLSVDDLVKSVSLYKVRPLIFHGTILPFVIPYFIWFYLWLFVYGWENFKDAGFVGTCVIAVFQILTCLACYWSVHVQCFLTCKKVSRFFSCYLFIISLKTCE